MRTDYEIAREAKRRVRTRKHAKMVSRTIKEYGQANRYWYTHQADEKAADKADRLMRKIDHQISFIYKPQLAQTLRDAFLREHYSTNFMEAAL